MHWLFRRGVAGCFLHGVLAAMFLFAAAIHAQPAPVIAEGGVADAAGFQPAMAPGSIGSIFGLNFSAGSTQAGDVPLPVELLGTRVEINGAAAPLFFLSPRQINFQMPFEIAPGQQAQVQVFRGESASPPAFVQIEMFAPAVYVNPATGVPIVQRHPEGDLISGENPARPGDTLTLYVNGIGGLDNPPPTGQAAPLEPLARALVWPTVTIGGQAADVLFAGLTPNLVGVGQIDFTVPETLTPPAAEAPQPQQGVAGLRLTIFFGDSASLPVPLPFELQPVPEPRIEVSPSGLNFDAVPVGETRSLTLTIRNTGQADLVISGFTADAADFALSRPSLPFVIPPEMEQGFTVTFRPSGVGRRAGLITIVSNDPRRQAIEVLMVGTGAGTEPQIPVLSVAPRFVDFGPVAPGESATQSVSVSNTGVEPLLILSVAATNPQFEVITQPIPVFLAPSETRLLTVRFTAVTDAPAAGELRIESSDPVNPVVTVALLANSGVPPPPPVPGELDFGSVPVGQSARLSAVVENPTERPIPITAITADHPDFEVVFAQNPFDGATPRPPFTLAVGGKVTVTVRFRPSSAGPRRGVLALHSSDPAAPLLRVELRGVGLAAAR